MIWFVFFFFSSAVGEDSMYILEQACGFFSDTSQTTVHRLPRLSLFSAIHLVSFR